MKMIYGIGSLKDYDLRFYPQIECGPKIYRLRDLAVIIPLGFLALWFGVLLGGFYTLFPHQLIWVAIYVLFSLLVL